MAFDMVWLNSIVRKRVSSHEECRLACNNLGMLDQGSAQIDNARGR
jgi:hypothetical protein